MTPHTPSGFVDVRSDAASLQPALVSLHALPDANTHTHSQTVQLTSIFVFFFFFKSN